MEKIGGVDTVTAYAVEGDGDYRLSQQTEDVLNTTRIRALPRQNVGIIIAEALNEAVIVQTNFVATIDGKKFDWSKHNERKKKTLFEDIGSGEEKISLDDLNDRDKLARYKIEMSLSDTLDGSDLLSISYSSIKLEEGEEEDL